jgi:glycosyltransferase involved in cell wall biosynthesis
MRISVVVPNLNYATFLRACLDSIAAQTHADIEVILIDAGSTDGSQEIMLAYAQKAGWRYLLRPQESQIESISWGLAIATGEIQCWLNSDDMYVRDDALSRVAAVFSTHRAVDCVSFGGYYLDAAGHITSKILLLTHPLFRQADIVYRMGGFVQPATFWRQRVFAELGFDHRCPHSFDSDFLVRACHQFNVMIDQGEAVAGYRLHGKNLSMGVKSNRVRELAYLNRKHFGARARFLSLMLLCYIIRTCDVLPDRLARPLKRIIYSVNNLTSYATIYRWPSI